MIKNSFLAIAYAVLVACSSGGNDDPNVPPTPTEPDKPTAQIPIKIGTTITRATETAFESGDRMGLFVVNRNADGSAAPLLPSGNYVDNMLYTFSTTWNAATTIYWKDEVTHADFYMYHPYSQTVASVDAMPFDVTADQSNVAAYKASDLIVGSTLDVRPTASVVNISARHVMSQVEIKLKAGDGFTDSSLAVSNVSVRMNNLVCSATISLATSDITAGRTAGSVIPYKDGDVYRAIVVPQTVTSSNFITVIVDGNEYNLSKTITFVSGKHHTLTVTLSKASSGVNVSIRPWEDDGIDYGGIAI